MSYAGIFANPSSPKPRPLSILKPEQGGLILSQGSREVASIEQSDAKQKERLHPDAGIIGPFGNCHRFSREGHGEVHFAPDDAPGEIAE